MAAIAFDFGSDFDTVPEVITDAQAWLAREAGQAVEVRVLQLRGPGGGLPYVEASGERGEIEAVARALSVATNDGDPDFWLSLISD